MWWLSLNSYHQQNLFQLIRLRYVRLVYVMVMASVRDTSGWGNSPGPPKTKITILSCFGFKYFRITWSIFWRCTKPHSWVLSYIDSKRTVIGNRSISVTTDFGKLALVDIQTKTPRTVTKIDIKAIFPLCHKHLTLAFGFMTPSVSTK